SALFDSLKLATTAIGTEQGHRLTDVKAQDVLGGLCDLLLLAAALDRIHRRFVVETSRNQPQIADYGAIGLLATRAASILLENSVLPVDAQLGRHDFHFPAFIDQGALMRCGLAIGTSQAVLDYVIPSCNDRQAFGEPISHRQSVAFMISNL